MIIKKNNNRLDVFCSNKFSISRSLAQQYIKKGNVIINNEEINKINYNVKSSDNIILRKDFIKIDILYENDDFYIIFKPPGISVERAKTTPKSDRVLNECFDNLYNFGLVNRLDKPTSGIIILVKTSKMFYNFKQQFRNYTMKKQYYAYFSEYNFDVQNYQFEHFICEHNYQYFGFNLNNQCFCNMDKFNIYESFVETYKYTKTYYEKHNNYYKCYPVTGRTHQIRLMMDDLKLPIISINNHKIGLVSTAIAYKIK